MIITLVYVCVYLLFFNNTALTNTVVKYFHQVKLEKFIKVRHFLVIVWDVQSILCQFFIADYQRGPLPTNCLLLEKRGESVQR